MRISALRYNQYGETYWGSLFRRGRILHLALSWGQREKTRAVTLWKSKVPIKPAPLPKGAL